FSAVIRPVRVSTMIVSPFRAWPDSACLSRSARTAASEITLFMALNPKIQLSFRPCRLVGRWRSPVQAGDAPRGRRLRPQPFLVTAGGRGSSDGRLRARGAIEAPTSRPLTAHYPQSANNYGFDSRKACVGMRRVPAPGGYCASSRTEVTIPQERIGQPPRPD